MVEADIEWRNVGGRQLKGSSGPTAISMACERTSGGCELSVTEYVHESRKGASGVPANTRVAGAKAIPDGSVPPAQVREYVYGSTPPEAAGSGSEW